MSAARKARNEKVSLKLLDFARASIYSLLWCDYAQQVILMLLRFKFKNWMSFRDETEFSMVASRERQHGQRVASVPKYRMRLLPITAIYGGNASGKTNLFKALAFARRLIVQGIPIDTLIPVQPFRLDPQCLDAPVRMCFELLIDGTIYEFSFAVTSRVVVEEKLVAILTTGERVLYHRCGEEPHFDNRLSGLERLNFAFEGTRDNQLFLTNAVSQKVDEFKPIYNWFKNSLVLIAPDSRFGSFDMLMQEEHPLSGRMSRALNWLDTGISNLGADEVDIDALQLPETLHEKLMEVVKEGESVRLRLEPNNERYVISRGEGGELAARKLVAYHRDARGRDVKFDIAQESDGSQRLIDLLPAFLEAREAESKKLFVIDEIDRSLHTQLTRELLSLFLNICHEKTQAQILFTTHDLMLMDQDFLRRDEMWVTEREGSGNSTLIAFSDYKEIRYDKDIRKSYLQGRMGGVPRLMPVEELSCAEDEVQYETGGK